jgi:hypothetical protein
MRPTLREEVLQRAKSYDGLIHQKTVEQNSQRKPRTVGTEFYWTMPRRGSLLLVRAGRFAEEGSHHVPKLMAIDA